MPFLLSVYMTNLSRLFQLVQQLRMLTDFFDDSFLGTYNNFLGTSIHKNPHTLIHSCHHPSTPNESADNGWQDSCHLRHSPATGA